MVAVAGIAQGLAVINTIPAPVVDAAGAQALPGEGRLLSGVCGASIRWAGLEMVSRVKKLRTKHHQAFTILGVGGVLSAADALEYLDTGADVVQSATGAMWHPDLGQAVYNSLYP
jgi:dihydroorotate dehydrogenase